MKKNNSYPAKPFVKWAGGKTQLLGEIEKALPRGLSQWRDAVYVEPFVGGGAVLFWILQKYPNISRVVVNDINTDLIYTYLVVRDCVDSLISALRKLENEYLALEPAKREEYYLVQRENYNRGVHGPSVQRAALFIFLNKTCFNGLYRVNSKGEFNVPHGRYAKPKICDVDTLMTDSALLQDVQFLNMDFKVTARYADRNAIFYIDPPYRPLTKTSSFASYTRDGFSDRDQVAVSDFCRQINSKGALFIASNSDPSSADNEDDFFEFLYCGFHIRKVSATRAINSKGIKRGTVSELMITNY